MSVYEKGYRYIILHERGCYLVRPNAGTALYRATRAKLIRRFGEPLLEEKEFAAALHASNYGSHISQGLDVGWLSAKPALGTSRRPVKYHMAVFRVGSHVGGLFPEAVGLEETPAPDGELAPPSPAEGSLPVEEAGPGFELPIVLPVGEAVPIAPSEEVTPGKEPPGVPAEGAGQRSEVPTEGPGPGAGQPAPR